MNTLDDEFRFLDSDATRVGHTGPLPGVRRVWATVRDDRRMSGLVYHPDSAPRHVFLHGAGLNAHGYDPTVLALGTAALALDLPGHGRSDWRADATYSPHLLAPDVTLAVRALTSAPVMLVGHSLGGLTAAAASAELGEAIHHLVLIDITPGIVPKRDAGTVAEFITGQRDFGSHDEMVDRAIAFGLGHDRGALTRGVALNSRRRPDGRWEWTHHLAHLPTLPIAGADATSASQGIPSAAAEPFAALWEPLGALRERGVAVSLIAAESGLVTAAMLEQWRDLLPGSAVETVAGPHNLHEAAPRELAAALTRLGARG